MPLIYGPGEMTSPQPKNFVTPSRTTGIYVQNVSPLALIITSGLGSIELPPWQTATLEMMPNDNMAVSAIPITAVPPALAVFAYVDISYTFQGVTVQGSGLFFPFMTPGGDAVAAGIMGPDGLQVGTSTSNQNGSSLLTQLTGRNTQELLYQTNVTVGAGATVNLSVSLNVAPYKYVWGGLSLAAAPTSNVYLYCSPRNSYGQEPSESLILASVSSAGTQNAQPPQSIVAPLARISVYNAGTASATVNWTMVEGAPN